ncbi:DNA-(apurinic or apyrimidinic site) lyase /endonuclease III [Bryocella elongata]|uniref:Endonuclease III n=1 Tax=Bryocella elongata TaxID=863522 RepID=A0A1H5UI34_9BACT|nr:endonuclease III [Bryocella elongata]SEF74713.1 DNA-(apurinic or apyrimidinic site) lyase /endonuclease III [Bryocella elongata]
MTTVKRAATKTTSKKSAGQKNAAPKKAVRRSIDAAGAGKQPTRGLTPPQKLTAKKRELAIEGVPAAKARKIAGGEPVAKKKSAKGGTAKPLAPERIAAILDALRKTYPNVVCALTHRNAFELLIATILSAQTTDVTVNKVTPELFDHFPTPQALAKARIEDIERIIKPTGFFHSKAKNIQGAGRVLVEKFGGKVPQTIDELTQIPGAARKTANVVLGSWFGIASGIVVDTHVGRLSRRLELTKNEDPVKVEQDLTKIIPQDRWVQFSHELIHHGRQVCLARKPHCVDCSVEKLCNSGDKTWTSH